MEPSYKYYMVEPGGVTSSVLNEAHILTSTTRDHFRFVERFSRARKFDLGIWSTAHELLLPVFIVRKDSIYGADIEPMRVFKREHGIPKWYIDDKYATPAHDLVSPIRDEFTRAGLGLCTLAGYRDIEDIIEMSAYGKRVTSSDLLTVCRDEKILKAVAYNVRDNWIYKVPVATSGKHFIPPHSFELATGIVDKLTSGKPLETFRSEHRHIWSLLDKYPRIRFG